MSADAVDLNVNAAEVIDAPAVEGQSTDPTLSASVQVFTLSEGVYLFSVREASPEAVPEAGKLLLPAVFVGPAPGSSPSDITIMPGPHTSGHWLRASDDILVLKVTIASASVFLISVRGPGDSTLAIDVDRLENRGGSIAASPTPLDSELPGAAVSDLGHSRGGFRLRVVAHIRNRGDVTFTDAVWVGRAGRGLWIEAFSITPLEALAAGDVECKALTATGIETPWVSNGALCGTRGLGVPLVGFAVRLKPEASARYECQYIGYFQSRAVVGPVGNGQPCRSTMANDPLEGMQLHLVPRDDPGSPKQTPGSSELGGAKPVESPKQNTGNPAEPQRPPLKGPKEPRGSRPLAVAEAPQRIQNKRGSGKMGGSVAGTRPPGKARSSEQT